MKKLFILFTLILLVFSVNAQLSFTSYKNHFIKDKNGKFITEKENLYEIKFVIDGNVMFVDDLANSRYSIISKPTYEYQEIGKYTFFSAIDEKNIKCTIILFKPTDDDSSPLLSILYDNWGIIYFIYKNN